MAPCRCLVLGNNKLTRVPDVIAYLTALESLDLGDNMSTPEDEGKGLHFTIHDIWRLETSDVGI